MIIQASGTATLVDATPNNVVVDLTTTGIYALVITGLTGVGMVAASDILTVGVVAKVLSTSTARQVHSYSLEYGVPNLAIDWADDEGWVSGRIINTYQINIWLTSSSWAGDVDWALVKVQ